MWLPPGKAAGKSGSAEANLAQDALAGEQFSRKTNHEAHHGQTAIPGFSKSNEAEASWGWWCQTWSESGWTAKSVTKN